MRTKSSLIVRAIIFRLSEEKYYERQIKQS